MLPVKQTVTSQTLLFANLGGSFRKGLPYKFSKAESCDILIRRVIMSDFGKLI